MTITQPTPEALWDAAGFIIQAVIIDVITYREAHKAWQVRHQERVEENRRRADEGLEPLPLPKAPQWQWKPFGTKVGVAVLLSIVRLWFGEDARDMIWRLIGQPDTYAWMMIAVLYMALVPTPPRYLWPRLRGGKR